MKLQELISNYLPSGMNTLADIIGPQGNLLEKLESFNQKYLLPDGEPPLKVTKTWRWGNGTYDKVKIAYNRKVMQWHKRPRGMETLFNRKRNWYENDIKRELLNIEKYLVSARRDGAVWLDPDTDDGLLEQYLYEFSSKIKELESHLSKECENWRITQLNDKTNNRSPYVEGTDDIIPGYMFITAWFPSRPIKVLSEGNKIIEIDFPAIRMHIKIEIARWMASLINPNTLVDGYNARWQTWFNLALDYDVPAFLYDDSVQKDEVYSINKWPIYHPFIHSRTAHASGWYWRNHCWGSHGTDILTSFMNMDFNAFFLHMNNWLYNYELIGANPLNNIRKSFLGISKSSKELNQLLDNIGYNYDECNNQLFSIFTENNSTTFHEIPKVLNYCNNIKKCILRDKCNSYKKNSFELIIANNAYSMLSIEDKNEYKIKDQYELIYSIHRKITDIHELRLNPGRESAYLGLFIIWNKLFKGDIDKQKIYDSDFIKHRQLSLQDNIIINYLISNKYFDSYLSIMAYNSCAVNDWMPGEKFDKALKGRSIKMKATLDSCLISYFNTEELTDEEKEKRAMQREMLDWTSKIRNNN